MYLYDTFDQAFVRERQAQFADQVRRRLAGEITEDEFKPLRLMNGLYLQLHAYMYRIAIPYGVLSSNQLRRLAHIARTYDRGFGHFTTRTNIQFHWIRLADAPQILAELNDVEMSSLQTSGNCIRNTTTDQFAAAARDEIEDPRPWCELIRQWSSNHPEFSFLPRKFKIAVTAATKDRAAIRLHDIGLHLTPDGFDVYVGGGMGRTPALAHCIRKGLPGSQLIGYLEACLRVYNRYGRRDNSFKARIKILVNALGPQEYKRQVEEEWATLDTSRIDPPEIEIDRIRGYFPAPELAPRPFDAAAHDRARAADPEFARWVRNNLNPHKNDDYVSVTVSLKPIGKTPGDISHEQMDLLADLSDRFGTSELRVTHAQNIVLPHIARADLYDLYRELDTLDLTTANIGKITDIICCPGLDYCSLANARSIPLAQAISNRFADAQLSDRIGDLSIKMSGCINACGHHHNGNIGILGVDKQGVEYYQILLGGRADENAALGQITGKGLAAEAVPDAVERVVRRYLELRRDDAETFIETLERLGRDAFAEALHEPA